MSDLQLRQAFESLQCSAIFERLEYIEVGGLYAVKDEFRECIFTLTKCNELNFGWRMYQAAIQKSIAAGEELQSWLAVNSMAAGDCRMYEPVISANDIANKIQELTGAKA